MSVLGWAEYEESQIIRNCRFFNLPTQNFNLLELYCLNLLDLDISNINLDTSQILFEYMKTGFIYQQYLWNLSSKYLDLNIRVI